MGKCGGKHHVSFCFGKSTLDPKAEPFIQTARAKKSECCANLRIAGDVW